MQLLNVALVVLQTLAWKLIDCHQCHAIQHVADVWQYMYSKMMHFADRICRLPTAAVAVSKAKDI